MRNFFLKIRKIRSLHTNSPILPFLTGVSNQPHTTSLTPLFVFYNKQGNAQEVAG